MKSRRGFVSNSSSCSFVLAIKESDVKSFYESLDPIQVALLEQFNAYNSNQEFMGESLRVYTGELGYIDEDGLGIIAEVLTKDENWTDDDIDNLDGYQWDESEITKRFKKQFGYEPCLSEAFDKIDISKIDCFYEEISD